jgi:iron(III) transport system substrate-binding protein
MKRFLFLTSLLPLALFTPAFAAEEVRVYSGRHYNTDRQVYKKFQKKPESRFA